MTSSDSGDDRESGQGDSPWPPTHQPYGGQPQYGQSPYGQTGPGQHYGQPYGQQPEQPPYGQQPYGAPGYGYSGQAPVNHPSATTALVLGLVGLIGIVACGGITLVLSPFAWRMGARAVRDIDDNPNIYTGRDQANAGRIMGLIGTLLLGLGVLAFVAAIALLGIASVSTSP